MLDIEKILIPTDFSFRSRRLIALTRPIVTAAGAELHVLHDQENPESKPAAGLASETVIHADFPDDVSVDAVIDYCDREGIDTIASAISGRWSLLNRTPVALMSGLIRRTNYPVLRVPVEKEGDSAAGERVVNRILAPIDFSDYASEALQHARELAAIYEASLHLYFVAEEHTVVVFSDAGVPSVSSLKTDPEITGKADEALRQLYESTEGPDIDVSFEVGHGHPAREILQLSERESVDLIVMATHGLSGYEPFALGSVTERVLRRTERPVFVLKAFGHSLIG